MKTKSLLDICSPKQWKTISLDMLTQEGYPVYGANGIIGKYKEYNHKERTLLVTCRGATCGSLNICEPYSYVTGNSMALDNLTPDIKLEYLYYYLSFRGFNDIITGSAQPQIVRNAFTNVLVTYPTLDQQHKIVSILDQVNDLISLRNQQLEQLDLIVKSRFVEMFGDPVINSQGRKQVPFASFMTGIRYGTSQPPKFSENGVFKFIRATNIKNGRIIESNMLRISEEEASKIEKCKLESNEIIIVRSGANTGDTCVVTPSYSGNYAGYDIIVTLDLERANPIFFNELINTNYMELVVKPLTARTAQPHINAQQVSSLPMLTATLREQNQFAEFVQQVDKSKFAIKKSLEQLETLKKKLMQDYFG